MSTVMILPRLGETMEQGRVVVWLKQPGDSFVRGETIVEIETDKTVVELPALADGVLRRIAAEAGTDVDVGAPLGEYDPVDGEGAHVATQDTTGTTDDGRKPAVPASALAAVAAAQARPSASPASRVAVTRIRATPKARRLARQHRVELITVPGTGRRGRVQGRDVQVAIDDKAGITGASAAEVMMLSVTSGRIAYRESPGNSRDDAPLVLLHGFAADSQAWAVLSKLLQRNGRRVIAPDLPSHGATDFDCADATSMAAEIADFIGQLQLPSIELVGHSLGAVVATKVASVLGARVRRLTLIAPAGLGSEIDGDFIQGMADVTRGGGLAHLLRRIALKPLLLSAQQLDQMAEAIHGRRSLVALARSMVSCGRQQVDIVSALASLQGHARIVWGLDDQIIPWQHATRAGSGIPVFFVAQAGHMPHWDQPEKVAALFT